MLKIYKKLLWIHFRGCVLFLLQQWCVDNRNHDRSINFAPIGFDLRERRRISNLEQLEQLERLFLGYFLYAPLSHYKWRLPRSTESPLSSLVRPCFAPGMISWGDHDLDMIVNPPIQHVYASRCIFTMKIGFPRGILNKKSSLLVSVDRYFANVLGNVHGTYRLGRWGNRRIRVARPVVVIKDMTANEVI